MQFRGDVLYARIFMLAFVAIRAVSERPLHISVQSVLILCLVVHFVSQLHDYVELKLLSWLKDANDDSATL